MSDPRLRNALACARERDHPYYAAAAYRLAQEAGDTAAMEEALRLGAANYRREGPVYARTEDGPKQDSDESMSDTLKAPYPFFGGKSRIAGLVWSYFGRADNYVEPFFGSGAILLGRPIECGANPSEPWPHCFGTETVNDADGFIANFHRALQYVPDEVAAHADHPVSEIDLHAWHRTLVDSRERVERMLADPKYYDAELAGRWVWGISQWIGTGWCPQIGAASAKTPHLGDAGRGPHRESLSRQMPNVGHGNGWGASERGVQRIGRKMPFIASPSPDRKQYGLGVHGKRLSRQIPHLGGEYAAGQGVFAPTMQGALYDYFRALSVRLRRVRVVCGDFARILGPSVTWRHGMTAVFLDPPYADDEHAITYSGGGNVWERVTKWCEENGDNPLLRIALCGYEGTWDAPEGWITVKWRTSGGYGSQGNGRGRENASRETIWFSPHCLNPSEQARDALSRPIAARDADWTGTLFEECAE